MEIQISQTTRETQDTELKEPEWIIVLTKLIEKHPEMIMQEQ